MKKFIVTLTEKERKSLTELTSKGKHKSQKILNALTLLTCMDNFDTHTPSSFYEVFPPDQAKALWDMFEFVYTPKHRSWLNMAEIKLNVLIGQCSKRRIDNVSRLSK